MSSEFGYIPESPEQSFGNNKGIFTPTDIYDLTRADKYTNYGQLELIQTQTVTSSTSAVDFTNLGNYNVHFLTSNNFSSTQDAEVLQPFLSNNGGTSFINSGYQQAGQIGDSNGNFSESRSTSTSSMAVLGKSGTGTGEHSGSYAYFYNLLDSSKYSFMTSHQIAWNDQPEAEFRFFSAVLPTAETHNAIRLTGGLGNIATLVVSLYGIKEYS
jgi:hypothetical protein